MKILDVLKSKPGGEAFVNRLDEVKSLAEPKLRHIIELFPSYTDHSIRHSESVLEILDNIMPDHIKNALNEWDLYFLVAAVYLHDIGMVENCPHPPDGKDWESFLAVFKERNENAFLTPEELENAASREYVRDRHHERSEEYIRANADSLGLSASSTPAIEGAIVGRISLGHRVVDLADQEQFRPMPFGNSSISIHRDLLAAYLRLADELDTTAYRTPVAEYEILKIDDSRSVMEWEKHFSIWGVSVDRDTIVIGGECGNFEVYLRLLELQKAIRRKLRQIRHAIVRPYVVSPSDSLENPVPYLEVELRLEHRGYLPVEIKFELEDDRIVELLLGERLYGDRTACIREVLQNSVDTCREAQLMRPSTWLPRIEVRLDKAQNTLTFSDNGMGMDETIVREYFSRIGVSYYQSEDFSADFAPISEFGIGFLSCFMIAESIVVETKRSGQQPLRIEIRSLTQPFLPSKGERSVPGTDVVLHLKPGVGSELDILERVRHYARYVSVPLFVVTEEDAVRVDRAVVSPDFGEIVTMYEGELQTRLEEEFASIDLEKFTLSHSEDGIELGGLLLNRGLPAVRGRAFYGGAMRIYQEGFLVDLFSQEFVQFGAHSWCDINLKGSARFQLTADRTRLTSSAESLWSRIREAYSASVEERVTRDNIAANSPAWWRYHLRYYSNKLDRLPKALEDEAIRNARFCVFGKDGFEILSVEQIRSLGDTCFITEIQRHAELDCLKGIFPVDTRLIVVPEITKWIERLLGENVSKDLQSLLGQFGEKSFTRQINGQDRWFFDTGIVDGPRSIGGDWFKTASRGIKWAHNASHPIFQVILKYCTKKLPASSGIFIDQLMSTRSRDTITYKQMVQVLRSDGVIPVDETLPELKKRSDRCLHNCPYSNDPIPIGN